MVKRIKRFKYKLDNRFNYDKRFWFGRVVLFEHERKELSQWYVKAPKMILTKRMLIINFRQWQFQWEK